MIIGVDLDDVLADTMGPLIRFHNETYGTKLRRKHFTSSQWTDVWGGTTTQAVNKFFEFRESHHYQAVQPVDDAVDAIDELSKNHELIVISSRQREFLNDTKKWVKEHFPNKFRDIILTNHVHWARSGENATKLEVCKRENVEVLIEDNLEFATECATGGVKGLLFDTPWNQGNLPKNVHRVYSWKEVVEHEVIR